MSGKYINIKIPDPKADSNFNAQVKELRSKLIGKKVKDFGQKDWRNLPEYLQFALSHIPEFSENELYLELGVFTGATLKPIRNSIPEQYPVYGFDAFDEGLPEDWGTEGCLLQPKGKFKLDYSYTNIEKGLDNVTLVNGYIQDTLAPFLREQNKKVRFVHLDMDLFSSTEYALSVLFEYFTNGTILVFDDFTHYPGWEEHSFKALAEMLHRIEYKFEIEPIASAGLEEDDPECKGWSTVAFLLKEKFQNTQIEVDQDKSENTKETLNLQELKSLNSKLDKIYDLLLRYTTS